MSTNTFPRIRLIRAAVTVTAAAAVTAALITPATAGTVLSTSTTVGGAKKCSIAVTGVEQALLNAPIVLLTAKHAEQVRARKAFPGLEKTFGELDSINLLIAEKSKAHHDTSSYEAQKVKLVHAVTTQAKAKGYKDEEISFLTDMTPLSPQKLAAAVSSPSYTAEITADGKVVGIDTDATRPRDKFVLATDPQRLDTAWVHLQQLDATRQVIDSKAFDTTDPTTLSAPARAAFDGMVATVNATYAPLKALPKEELANVAKFGLPDCYAFFDGKPVGGEREGARNKPAAPVALPPALIDLDRKAADKKGAGSSADAGNLLGAAGALKTVVGDGQLNPVALIIGTIGVLGGITTWLTGNQTDFSKVLGLLGTGTAPEINSTTVGTVIDGVTGLVGALTATQK